MFISVRIFVCRFVFHHAGSVCGPNFYSVPCFLIGDVTVKSVCAAYLCTRINPLAVVSREIMCHGASWCVVCFHYHCHSSAAGRSGSVAFVGVTAIEPLAQSRYLTCMD